MSYTHDVISAFLDDEVFDSNELSRVLSDSERRALLIDLLALRQMMQPAKDVVVIAAPGRPSRFRIVLAIAAVLMAMIGGYLLGPAAS